MLLWKPICVVDAMELIVSNNTYKIIHFTVIHNLIAGTDYTPVNQTVTLGPGNTVEGIMISVLKDSFTESNDEVVCVRTVLPERSQVPGVLLNSSNTNFTIIDSNRK